MFDPIIRKNVLCLRSPPVRYLSSGFDGGHAMAESIYAYSVPTGWDRRDVASYVRERRTDAGFDRDGPSLLTGVDFRHLRGAHLRSVTVYVSAGISNPASLPMEPTDSPTSVTGTDVEPPIGTVNMIVGTTRSLDDAGLASLMGVAVEAKSATLLAETGFPGTTTDAAIVATLPAGEPAEFSGSATSVGSATRACVRDAVLASLDSRYAEKSYPQSVADADHGVVTNEQAAVFCVDDEFEYN